jgi:hypothetical protein
MCDDTRHSPGQLQFLRHAERRLSRAPVGEIGTGADPPCTVVIGTEERDRAYQAPLVDAIRTRAKSQLRFESHPAPHRELPRFAALRFFFRRKPHPIVPSSPRTKTLVEPRLIHVGKLPVVACRPYRAWQRLRELLESCLAQFHGLFCLFEADGHQCGTKLPCRLDLHLAPGCTSPTDQFLPCVERISWVKTLFVSR